MKFTTIGIVGLAALLLGIAAGFMNFRAGTLNQAANLLVVVSLIAGGAAGTAAYATQVVTGTRRGGLPAPDAEPTPHITELVRGGQVWPSDVTQRDFEAIHHLASRAESCANAELRPRMFQHCRDLQDCLFELHHNPVSSEPRNVKPA
jgi:hypothetical protein